MKRPLEEASVAESVPAEAEDTAPEPPEIPLLNTLVFPGDEICAIDLLTHASAERLVLGSGVVRDGENLHACRLGTLRHDPPPKNRLWVEGESKRYVPALGDHVIGIIESKHAEEYRLHIGAAHPASLPVLAFDGATRRNRPHLEVGALVYARVVLAHRDMEPECSCAAPPGVSAKDWVTKESVFGELSGGHLFHCPQLLCARLTTPQDAAADDDAEDDTPPVLEALGARAPFELAVGANNRVWLSAAKAAVTVLAQAAILRSQGVRDADHDDLVDEIAEAFGVGDALGPTSGTNNAAAANAFMRSLDPRQGEEQGGGRRGAHDEGELPTSFR